MRKNLVESPAPNAKKSHFGLWRGRFYEVFAHIAMMSMLSLVRAADMYARDKFESRDLIRRGRHATPPRRARGPPTHQSRILPRYTLTEHRVSHKFKFSTNIVGMSLNVEKKTHLQSTVTPSGQENTKDQPGKSRAAVELREVNGEMRRGVGSREMEKG